MRIILERKDILSLLGKSLGYVLEDEDIEIQTDPFEVRISSVRLEELAQSTQVKEEEELPTQEKPYMHTPEDINGEVEGLIQQSNRMSSGKGDAPPIYRTTLGANETYDQPLHDKE